VGPLKTLRRRQHHCGGTWYRRRSFVRVLMLFIILKCLSLPSPPHSGAMTRGYYSQGEADGIYGCSETGQETRFRARDNIELSEKGFILQGENICIVAEESGVQSMTWNRLCGLEVRVPGYRSIGLGFDSRRYQIFWKVVGLERDPLSLARIIEELFQGNSGSGLENRD
jgi:hypothetical protein